MRSVSLAIAVLLGCGLGANAFATQDDPVAGTFVTGKSLDKTASRQSIDAVAMQAINDAAAAAVIGALATQLQDENVQFKLGEIDSSRVSLRDMALNGRGQIRLEGDSSWMPIRFQALYDTDSQTVESPAITFVAEHVRGSLDKGVAEQFDGLVDRKLAVEFAEQPVDFNMGSAGIVGGDTRFAVVEGDGIADFASEGKSDITVQGIYDRVAQRWIHVGYELGGERADPGRTIAAR